MVAGVKNKIIITGAKGLLGGALCKILSERLEVIALSHQDCDVVDFNKVRAIFSRERPDAVINAAALTDVDFCETNPGLAEQVNSIGAGNIARSCKEIGSVLIQVGTDYVFDGLKDGAYNEKDIPKPVNVYAKSKLDGEKAVRTILKEHFVIRVSWLFGSKGDDFVDMIVNRIDKKEELKIIDDKFSTPTYNVDVSKAILDLMQKMPAFGIYHIVNGGSCSWYDYTKEIVRLYSENEVKIEPMRLAEMTFAAKRPKNTVLDCHKFKETVGYELRPWQEALREYINLCYRN